jgi:hypothetical protein
MGIWSSSSYRIERKVKITGHGMYGCVSTDAMQVLEVCD